ncbi:oxidoreductase [Dyadobacter subterraneus]|uniref:SDR family NAD(P)-dependent oxidoreductase n=1 Tax=Dyadobacter subterraneus TaxID=2773304 RepID=A0ABR9WCL0_9BACT|nr:oxidoreductase [Dyadobacter subterraneus]MBE9463207.1 SDR family NAD(P)-dependent oxidoreductase [Dyadobacter subterraneus]
MDNKKVWFVTGASKGLGLSLVKQLLSAGYNVAATSRTVDSLSKAVESEESENFLPLEVSITSEQSVKDAVSKTIEKFGTIDVLVNNAGYGLFGSVEELSDEESRQNFDINVFGSLNVIRQTLPYMRAKRSGKIFNISSVGGFRADFPGAGIYCSTKFAVAGFTEGLASEVKELGISATVVYPGYFRTDFLSSESMVVPKNAIDDYATARASVLAHEKEIAGNQPGDPEKAIAVLIKIASEENTPVHLFLGKDAYEMAQGKIEIVSKDLEAYKSLTISTDFDS